MDFEQVIDRERDEAMATGYEAGYLAGYQAGRWRGYARAVFIIVSLFVLAGVMAAFT